LDCQLTLICFQSAKLQQQQASATAREKGLKRELREKDAELKEAQTKIRELENERQKLQEQQAVADEPQLGCEQHGGHLCER